MSAVSRSVDRVQVIFDDDSLVADAGLIVPATLLARLGLAELVDAVVRLGGRTGGALPGRKVLTLVVSMLVGGSHIDHADRLRAGATQAVLPFTVMAPSTLGTFLRAFTFGHVRQLDRVIAETIRRAWALGAGPGDQPVTIDLDSTICEVYGKQKHGVAYGYTRVLGYHPLVATRADTGEIVHARMRKGSSQRGHQRFVAELIARVRRCGATGPLTLRADSGFWSWDLIDTLTRLGVDWTITVAQNPRIRAAIAGISEADWAPIGYTVDGEAEVAETLYLTKQRNGRARAVRLIVRRTRLTEVDQQQLWPNWRHHAFLTSVQGDEVDIDRYHRQHATVELGIGDLKAGSGLEHCPSGRFPANGAWLACAVLAHNTIRWCARLGDLHPNDQLSVARTIRIRFFALPGRIVNHAGQAILRLPTHWPWANQFDQALNQIRSLPQLC